ncbi:helicase HerA domain-containing protein [Williamsia serinedens]|uniref:DNA helicase HerA, contains HAS-barrel and ATPase domains n=1 Tax=Williamsia serinedens TaxID=391736 RepID=A0ABT1H672_9NOCA|nr:AAA family ATPase [Williamsia serinedens]MCP2161362.1 DNA helicase HerA, contains HAS-barrel and ATPase domains [Williamsia serinedens]
MTSVDTSLARTALETVRLSWAPTPDDVWKPQDELHVGGLHDAVLDELRRAFADADAVTDGGSPLGVVVQGPAGSGKTHLLGQVREHAQRSGGYFFLIRLLDGTDFWRSVVVGMLEDLARPTPDQPSQLVDLIDALAREADLRDDAIAALTGRAELTVEVLEDFVTAVYRRHPRHRRRSQHVLRALVLRASDDFALQDLGDTFLHLDPGLEDELAEWGIRQVRLGHEEIAQNISRLLALRGPTVMAIDQIDTLVAMATRSDGQGIVEELAHGLMALRETMARTVGVVACISATWVLLEDHVLRSVSDRFRLPPPLQRPDDPDFGPRMLARRFRAGYASVGFEPPYPSWPIAAEAFGEAPRFTPRELLVAADQHINACLRSGAISELSDLSPAATAGGDIDGGRRAPTGLDARFDDLRAAADPSPALHADTEDTVVPGLLRVAFAAWLDQRGGAGDFRVDPPPSAKPALHGRLRRTIDLETDREFSWGFRSVESLNAVAALSRVRKAATAAGVTTRTPDHALVLLRSTPWPSGPKTRQTLDELVDNGGVLVAWTPDEVRTLMALATLLEERPDDLIPWLVARRPVDGIGFLHVLEAQPSDVESTADSAAAVPRSSPVPTPKPVLETSEATHAVTTEPVVDTTSSADTIDIGTAAGRPVAVELAALRKHTALFAGSGSGKTVLIRRIVEECALAGVSSIVLDVNNDLARMGEPWPEGSRDWTPEDAEQARRYFAGTEVVVYTPGRATGRPLSFQPLPDFADLTDPDEFSAAVDSAVAALAPRVNAAGTSATANRRQAMLNQAMRWFGSRGGGTLRDLIELLAELPPEVSDLRNPGKLASDIADGLRVAMANDPMLGGDADPMDPATLLTPSPGRRARVSVINLAGLTTEDKRDNFVNQLQMALFAHIRRHPAGDRPLGGLFVMDEAQNFAPAGRFTACTQSTLALASQARKYGLGLVFATQAPKGLNNKIPGNASTQFFGKLSSPVQIAAAREVATSKGSEIGDVGRLTTGRFYASIDGAPFVDLQAPLCLSHHPASPPTEDEVLHIARGDG